MAVSVPGWKAQETASTAAWPPKRMPRPRLSSMRPRLALVADRDRHVLDLELAHQLGDRPGDGRIHLDLEVVHALQRLMVFLAEQHATLGGLELHALHRRDQLLAVGGARLFQPFDHGD